MSKSHAQALADLRAQTEETAVSLCMTIADTCEANLHDTEVYGALMEASAALLRGIAAIERRIGFEATK